MARFATRITRHVQHLVALPHGEHTRVQRSLLFAINLVRHGWRKLKQDNALQMAAALTYHTVFSLLPILVVVLIAIGSMRGLEQYQDAFKHGLVDYLLPATLLEVRVAMDGEREEDGDPSAEAAPGEEVDAVAPSEAPATAEGAPGEAGDEAPAADAPVASEELQEARARLRDRVEALLERLETANFGGIGVVGFLLFLYGATMLLATVEASFNQIYDAEQGRPWYLRFVYYYTLITLGPVVLIAGQVAQSNFFAQLKEESWTNWLVGPMVLLSPLLTMWVVLLVLYRLLPRTHVKLRPAAIGSFVAALLWVVSKELFAIYVSRTAVTSLYGALGVVPLFLLWLFVTWLVVLFGLELSSTLQAMGSEALEEDEEDPSAEQRRHLCDPHWLIPIMGMIGREFHQGRTCAMNAIADELHIPRRALLHLIHQLEEAGYVYHLQPNEEGPRGLTLARPPDQIVLTDLIALGRSLTMVAQDGRSERPEWQVVDRLHQADCQTLASQTLASLLHPDGTEVPAGGESARASKP